MARDYMAEIEAFCFEMSIIYLNQCLFIINRDFSGKEYDDERPIVQDNESIHTKQVTEDRELTIQEAVLMGDRRVMLMESWIADYKEARSKMILSMGIEVPQIGRYWSTGKGDDFLFFVIVDGDADLDGNLFENRTDAESHAGDLANAYARPFGLVAKYRWHQAADKCCWCIE